MSRADDSYRATIDRAIHCAQCGYNLFTLPTIGRCPECGSPYNADRIPMQGIFFPTDRSLPWGDVLTTILCFGMTAGLAGDMLVTKKWTLAGVAFVVVFAVATWLAASISHRTIGRWLLFRRIKRDGGDV